MGKLVDGKWLEASIITADTSGRYDRQPRTFLNDLHETHSYFLPESNRYHLYISHACPWATRVMMYRSLKELDNHISFSVVHPDMLENGWTFSKKIFLVVQGMICMGLIIYINFTKSTSRYINKCHSAHIMG